LNGVLDKNDLEEIEKEVNNKKEFILQLKKEFLKIPENLRHYFDVRVDIMHRVEAGCRYSAYVIMMTSLIGGITIERSDEDFSNRTSFLIGEVKI